MIPLQELENELMHARVYDPVKAHEYYLRTRHLKGRRRRANGDTSSSRPGGQGDQGGAGGSSNSVLRDSRREKLEAQVEELRAKVERLRELVRQRVDKAKERAGVKDEPEKETSSSTKDKKDSKTKDSPDKKLTAAEKREKNEKAREQYAKENRTSLHKEVEALQRIAADLREKLAKLPKPDDKTSVQGGRSDKDGENGR